MAAERKDREEGFTVPAPSRALRTFLSHIGAATPSTVIPVTTQVREGNILHVPEKLDADAFPGLLVFNAQLFRGLDEPGTFEADVLTVPLEKIEEN